MSSRFQGLRDEREQSGVRIGSSLGTSRFSIPEGEHYRKAQANLAQLFEKSGTLPPVKELNGEVVRFGELAHSGGTYSDIWAGMWLGQHKVGLQNHIYSKYCAEFWDKGSYQIVERSGGYYD